MGIVLAVVLGGGDETPTDNGQDTTQAGTDSPSEDQPGEDPGSEAQDDPDGNGNVLTMLPPPGTSPKTPEMKVDGLVANWRFDEESDAMAVDSGGGKSNATFEGKPTFTPGPFGPAVKLNGTSDRIIIPATAFNEAEGTLALWVRPDADKAMRLVDTSGGRYVLSLSDNGDLSAAIGNDRPALIDSKVRLAKGQWYHVALAWKSDGRASIYCNAELVGKLDKTTKLNAPTNVTLGHTLHNKTFSAVTIDDVRVFGRALTDAELKKLTASKNITLQPPQSSAPESKQRADGLLVQYEFESSGSLSADTLKENDAENHGATTVTDPDTSRGKVLNLDGTDDYLAIPSVITNDFTISFWMKTATPGSARLLDGGGVAVSLSGDRVAFTVSPSGAVFSQTIVTDNKWHLVVAQRTAKSGQIILTIDGRQEDTAVTKAGALPKSQSKLFAGRNAADATLFFNGQIDDLRLYSKSLSKQDVDGKIGGEPLKQLIAARPAPPQSAPPKYGLGSRAGADVEYWTELDGQGLPALTKAITDQVAPVAGKDRIRTTINSLVMSRDQAFGPKTGQRVRGYLRPPATGEYIISTHFDGNGVFQLSTDANPSNLQPVNRKVHLQAGHSYFFELLHKQDAATGSFSVGWVLPDGTQESPLPAARLGYSSSFKTWVKLPIALQNISSDQKDTFEIISDEKNRFHSVFVNSEERRGSTYEITIPVDLEHVTAFRLDALPDDSKKLFANGPGWGRNGAYSISEFQAFFNLPGSTDEVPVSFREAVANDGTVATLAIDNVAEKRWSVRGGGNASSLIVIPTAPLKLKSGSRLSFRIACSDNLGRFALRATGMNSQSLAQHITNGNFSERPSSRTASNRTPPFEIHINGGPATNDPTDIVAQRQGSPKWSAKARFGYVNGGIKNPDANNSPIKDLKAPAATCIEGLTEFKVRVPHDDKYTVALVFFENWGGNGQRTFNVQIGDDVRQITTGRQPKLIMEADVKGGLLSIQFKPVGNHKTMLTAISVKQK